MIADLELMPIHLLLLKSLNTQAVLKRGKNLKFVGEGIDFRAYQNGNDSVLTLKNSNTQLPIQEDEKWEVEIEDIGYSLQNTFLRGRIINGLGKVRGWIVQRLGDKPRPFNVSENGNFTLENITAGIYSVFNESNPSMKTDVAISPEDEEEFDIDDPRNPLNPIYDTLYKQTIRVLNASKTFPWKWRVDFELSEGPDENLYHYQVIFIDKRDDWQYIQDIVPNYGTLQVSDDSTEELYHSEYKIVMAYRISPSSMVCSNYTIFRF
jgi:hypothetical protein